MIEKKPIGPTSIPAIYNIGLQTAQNDAWNALWFMNDLLFLQESGMTIKAVHKVGFIIWLGK